MLSCLHYRGVKSMDRRGYIRLREGGRACGRDKERKNVVGDRASIDRATSYAKQGKQRAPGRCVCLCV
jgi:hypothetical protein